MPTVANTIDLIGIAKACGYEHVSSIDNFDDLDNELEKVKNNSKLSFIEIKSSIGAREDLGRPTTTATATAIDNKINFMNFLI